MNANEGLLRIAKVVRWAGYIFSVLIVVLAAALNARENVEFSGVLVTVVGAAIVAGGGWTLAWIIEGFAKPKP